MHRKKDIFRYHCTDKRKWCAHFLSGGRFMNILVVAPYPPSRIRIRLYGFVTHLARQHNVTVLALCSSKREAQAIRICQNQGLLLIAVQDKRLWKALRALRAIFTPLPLQVAFDASPRLRTAIEQQLAEGTFDLIHVEFIRALGALPSRITVPAVWDAVDCISELYEQGGRFGATALLRWLGTFEARRVRAYECAQMTRFQQVLVTSARDREALLRVVANDDCEAAKRNAARIAVLPHGVNLAYPGPSRLDRSPDILVFSGKMSFHANVAAALLLAKQIMPLIWRQRPDVRLIIAGSSPPASVRRLACHQQIEVTGYVPDLRSYIGRARVAVCPLPYAVGIQNKILEAMALGTPVVASPQAADGLQAIAGSDLLVAADPETFASMVLRVLDDPQLQAALSARGRMYVATYHNWTQIAQQLDELYARALNLLPVEKQDILSSGLSNYKKQQ